MHIHVHQIIWSNFNWPLVASTFLSKVTSLTPPYFATGSFKDQFSSYMSQLGSSEYQRWVIDAIEKEKLKQQHLKVVINHLESEVSNLAQETVNQMECSMEQVRGRRAV